MFIRLRTNRQRCFRKTYLGLWHSTHWLKLCIAQSYFIHLCQLRININKNNSKLIFTGSMFLLSTLPFARPSMHVRLFARPSSSTNKIRMGWLVKKRLRVEFFTFLNGYNLFTKKRTAQNVGKNKYLKRNLSFISA